MNPNTPAAILPASESVIGKTLYYDPNPGPDAFPSFPGIDVNGHTNTTKYLQPLFAKFGWSQPINVNCDCSDNHYNSFQLSLSKRFSQGLNLTANYALQQARDYDASYFAIDKKVGYGPEDLTRKQAFTMFGFYQLPFGRKGQFLRDVPKWVDYFIGGYEVSTIVTIQSGLPFTANYLNCGANVPAGSAPCTPNQSGSLHTGLTKLVNNTRSYFTPLVDQAGASTLTATSAPFSLPSLDQIGNAPRNGLWGPGFWNADLSISKDVPIRENLQLQFRMDAFNAFNHINPGNPVNCIDCVVGGTIFGMATNASPRQLVFAAKVTF